MKSKLWNKLFTQAIPFFALVYMLFSILWISADYVLAFLNHTPVGDLSVQLAIGVPVAIMALVVSTGFDHWLQDHYRVDGEGRPLARAEGEEEPMEVMDEPGE